MDQTLVIFGSIALVSIAVLCVTLAIVAFRAAKNLDKMTLTIESVGHDVSQLKTEALPLLAEATSVMKRADDALDKVDGSIDQISQGAKVIKAIAQDARDLEQDFVSRLKQPMDELSSLAAGAVSGFSSFVKSLLDR